MSKKVKSRYDRNAINKSLNKTGTYYADVTPTSNLMFVLQNAGYTYYQAVCDILDNSFDAGAQNLYIEVGAKDGDKSEYVNIADDGNGMSPETMCAALVIGGRDEDLPTKVNRTLGKYHTGLKSSILGLEGKAVLYSKQSKQNLIKSEFIKEDIENHYNKTGEWRVPIMNGKVISDEERDNFKDVLDNSESGTIVNIFDVNKKYTTNRRNVLKKEVRRIYRRYLAAGKTIKINKSKLKPFDPMFYDVPAKVREASGKMVSKKSELLQTMEFDDIKYTDENGVERDGGYLKYTSYCLPDTELGTSKELGINATNQGFYVMRNEREIVAGASFGLFTKQNLFNRFRVEIEFGDELDSELKVDFKKTSIDLSQRLKDRILPLVNIDTKRVDKEFVHQSRKDKKTGSDKLKKALDKMSRHLERKSALLGKIKETKKTKVKTKKPRVKKVDPNKTTRPYKARKTGFCPWIIDYDDNLSAIDPIMDGYLIEAKREIIKIVVNRNHAMYTDYLAHLDADGISPIFAMMYCHFKSREKSLVGIQSEESREELLEIYEQSDAYMGQQLAIILKNAPGSKK